MCGLFGTTRPHAYPLADAASEALLDLGYLAQTRGVDSAGLATVHRHPVKAAASTTTVHDQVVGATRIVTALGRFDDELPQWPRLQRHLGTAHVVLGHTRWATQGRVTLANASPMLVGDVVGTHNGDVTVPARVSGTDTAWVLRMLNRTRSARSAAAVLTGLRGRAALAWTRLDRPDSVYLARAALSPLYTAYDGAGGLWWASNPDWLRMIARGLDGMTTPTSVPEGNVLIATRGAEEVRITAAAKFAPTCRLRDEMHTEYAWRGFTGPDLHRARTADTRRRVAW